MTEQERQLLQDNVAAIREKIARAAEKSGRSEKDIAFIAATKMNGTERVQAALRCGIDAAGENRVQELLEKYEQGAYLDKPLHFIGTLQTNKIKYLIGKTCLIQSVDSLHLGKAIAKEATKKKVVQDILLEVNIGLEDSKSGFHPDAVDEAIDELRAISGIRICGLMTIPPVSQGITGNNAYFCKMQQLYVDISAKKYDNVDMCCLSMGMSDDYADAISCGSNMVRIGRAVFGARQYP